MPNGPTLKTFEEFLTAMGKEDEATKRYFFKQIEFAQRESERLRAKNKRRYYKLKAARDAQREAAAAAQEGNES